MGLLLAEGKVVVAEVRSRVARKDGVVTTGCLDGDGRIAKAELAVEEVTFMVVGFYLPQCIDEVVLEAVDNAIADRGPVWESIDKKSTSVNIASVILAKLDNQAVENTLVACLSVHVYNVIGVKADEGKAGPCILDKVGGQSRTAVLVAGVGFGVGLGSKGVHIWVE